MTWNNFKKWVEGEKEAFDFSVSPTSAPTPAAKKKKDFSLKSDRLITTVSVVTAAVLLLVMLSVVYTLPPFGSGNATDNELTERYVEQGMNEVGAQNLVANMILVYRGFDTFGESTVLFTAAVCVIMLLMGTAEKPKKILPEQNTTILKTVVRGIFPFILIFGVYILLNGHLSPGGGFSGGSILGAGIILLDVSLGTETVQRFFSGKVFNAVRVGALCFYGAAITWLSVCGANGLDNRIGTGLPGHLFSAGLILPINLAVGCVVACTMYAFFTYFYRGELK